MNQEDVRSVESVAHVFRQKLGVGPRVSVPAAEGLGFKAHPSPPHVQNECGCEVLGARYRARLGHVFRQKLGVRPRGLELV